MVKTAILNDRVQESRIYPDTYDNCPNDEPVEPSRPAIFLETQKDTMQVPFGTFSLLNALMEGSETAFDTAIYQCYNAFSNWDWGISHSLSIRHVGKLFAVSHQYVQQALSRLSNKKWMKRLSGKHKVSKFELKHHLCEDELVPLDKDGRPSKCAMPRGYGGLFERLMAGDIHWKAVIIWMLMKLESDWCTGITAPISIKQLRKWTRFGTSDICKYIKQLIDAGMLKKHSRRPHEAQVYQLFPKPPAKRTERQPEQEWTYRNMRAEGPLRYSFNEEWRVNVDTGVYEYREDKKKPFRPASDYRIAQEMPKSMKADFEMCLQIHKSLLAALGKNQN